MGSALVLDSQQSLEPLPAKMTPTGMALEPGLRFEEWEAIGKTLGAIGESWLPFNIGDWINYGQANYGEKYAQALDVTGRSYSYLQDVAWVCGAVMSTCRQVDITFTHHRTVARARLSPDEQVAWLADARAHGWSVRELGDMIAQAKHQALVAPRHPCPDCGEVFAAPVWHCPTCNHHWSVTDRDCRNCHGEDTTAVFAGGDWEETPTPPLSLVPDAVLPPPPIDITSMVSTGSVRDLSIQEEFSRLMARLLGVANDARLLVRHVPPAEMARLLDNDSVNDERHVAPTLDWVQAVFAARDEVSTIRRIK